MSNGASTEALARFPRVTKYYYHGSRRVAQRCDGVVYYLHGDHLGSVSLATDAAGGFHSRQLFRPYGDTRYQAGTLPTDFGFAGQREDGSTGLLFMHARYYDARLGRFVSADTVVPEAGNPQAFNRYSYAVGNPVRYSDPSGHRLVEEPSQPSLLPGENPPPSVTSYERGDLVFDIVEFAPGTNSERETAEWQHSIGKVGHWAGLGIEALEAVGIAWDFPVPGEEDALAFIDIFAETAGSWGHGETYIGQPGPSLPVMLVVGQDVWVSGGDFALALMAKVVGGTVAGLPGIGVGEAVDMLTTGSSFVYDVGRVTDEIHTYGAIGFYLDEKSRSHVVILAYPPWEKDETLLHH